MSSNPLLCVVTGAGSSAPDGCLWHASRLRDLITPANSVPPDTAIGLVLEAAGAEIWNNGRLNIVLLIHNVHISHIHIRRIILNSIGDLRNWETISRRRRILYNLQSIDIGQQCVPDVTMSPWYPVYRASPGILVILVCPLHCSHPFIINPKLYKNYLLCGCKSE